MSFFPAPIVNYDVCPICNTTLPKFRETERSLLTADGCEARRQCAESQHYDSVYNFHYQERLLWNPAKKFPSQNIRIELYNYIKEDFDYLDIEYSYANDDAQRKVMSVMGNSWEKFNFHYKINSYSSSEEFIESLKRLNNFT